MTNICETIRELEKLMSNSEREEELKRILNLTIDLNSLEVNLSEDNKRPLADYTTAVYDALCCEDPLAIEKIEDGWEALICLGSLMGVVDYRLDREEIEVHIIENNETIISICMDADSNLSTVEKLQYTQWLDDCHNGRI